VATPVRKEHDAYGTVELPAECLYGLNTARAVEYFDFSGRTLGDEPGLVAGFAAVKQAAAAANRRTGCLDAEQADAIVRACDDMRSGRLSDWLVVDLLEGAGGTSLNMNVNEVLANAAIVRLGGNPGDYARVHPNDHVNRSQSTNDVVPSAISLPTMWCRARSAWRVIRRPASSSVYSTNWPGRSPPGKRSFRPSFAWGAPASRMPSR